MSAAAGEEAAGWAGNAALPPLLPSAASTPARSAARERGERGARRSATALSVARAGRVHAAARRLALPLGHLHAELLLVADASASACVRGRFAICCPSFNARLAQRVPCVCELLHRVGARVRAQAVQSHLRERGERADGNSRAPVRLPSRKTPLTRAGTQHRRSCAGPSRRAAEEAGATTLPGTTLGALLSCCMKAPATPRSSLVSGCCVQLVRQVSALFPRLFCPPHRGEK